MTAPVGELPALTPINVATLYWKLINAFREQTGIPAVLNTSFNENEPIVCKPEEAISVLQRTRMDALAIGSCLVWRRVRE